MSERRKFRVVIECDMAWSPEYVHGRREIIKETAQLIMKHSTTFLNHYGADVRVLDAKVEEDT